MTALEISHLSKTFKGKKCARVEALRDVSLTVDSGEIFGFLGPNGAGKSTTIKTLMGHIRPTSGWARIMNVDAASAEARRHVGYLPENPAFYDYLSAEEYLAFVGRVYRMTDQDIVRKSEEVLKLLELWDARKRPIRGYSKGMVQRVGLAQVLLHDPDIFILDEPMSGLDPIGRALVKEIIVDLKSRGKCVFFSTHITSDVESICDRVGIITKGSLRCVEQVDAIMAEGITGYRVGLGNTGTTTGIGREQFVARENLPKFMAEAHEKGEMITVIEPVRKNLEEFFLDIVKGKQ